MSPTFAELGVPAAVVDVLAKQGITHPFDIQEAAIPDAMAGRDICGRAPTGSGKTLAFGIPIVAQVGKSDSRRPQALILAPTRELANQIMKELVPMAQSRKRFVEAVYGGVNYDRQAKSIRRGVDILVACPGRLEDLISRGDVFLDDVRFVVIDEADRMADMGFLPPVRRLLDACRKNRQTMLFSATLDGDVAKLTAEYQKNPVRHEVGSTEPEMTAMRHVFWSVTRENRVRTTAHAIANMGPTIVFVRTRHGADRVARQLKRDGVDAAAIHGNRSQGQRERALASFAKGNVQALVATDVAARGVHVDDVACVIHFDPPEEHKAYVHRSGRTARAGAKGIVISLVQAEQKRGAKAMQRKLGLDVAITEPIKDALLDGPRPAPNPRIDVSRDRPSRPPRNQQRKTQPRTSQRDQPRNGKARNDEQPSEKANKSRDKQGAKNSKNSGQNAARSQESEPRSDRDENAPRSRKKNRHRDAESRRNHGAPKRSGGKPGNKTGGKPGNKTGGKPGNKTGGKPGNNAGSKPGNRSTGKGKPGTKPGAKTGGKPGGRPSNRSGAKSGPGKGGASKRRSR